MLLRCPGKEPLGGCDIPPSAQEKIDGAARFIHGAIEVDPLAFDLEVSLIHAPRVAHRPGVRLPTLFKIRHVALHPPQDRRMSQQDAALGHHLDQVTGTELESEVPSHTQNDDLLVKVPPLEQILCRGRFRHPGRYGCAPVFSSLHQNLKQMVSEGKVVGLRKGALVYLEDVDLGNGIVKVRPKGSTTTVWIPSQFLTY